MFCKLKFTYSKNPNGINVSINTHNTIMDEYKTALNVSNGLHNLNKTSNPANVKIKLAIVSNCPFVPTNLSNNQQAITFNVNIMAPGNAFVIRLGKNLPLIVSLLGCNAKKKDGIPITQYSSNII